jgi:hypothetical protein
VATASSHRESRFYHSVLKHFTALSHVTVEVNPVKAAA